MRPWIAILLVVPLLTAGTPVPPSAEASPQGTVLINELANGGSNSDSDTFFELRNWGDTSVDLSRWKVFRCSAQGLRSNVGRTEGDFAGVVLEPGEIFTVSRIGMPGDDFVSQPFDATGFGLYLENPQGDLVDGIGVYPNEPWPTQSECTAGSNLTNTLAFAFDESWQRVSATGQVDADFVIARSTLGEQNATRSAARADSTVVISELATSGPASTDDEFVELVNTGTRAQSIGGFALYRCTAGGRLRTNGLQTRVPDGTVLEPGARWVFGARGFTGRADQRYETELSDVAAGVLVLSPARQLVDRLAVSDYGDSACQDEKLTGSVDFVASESVQLTENGYVVAPRTPGTANRTRSWAVADQVVSYDDAGVAISEIATDPAQNALPAGVDQRNFVELANYGDDAVDIGGWTLRRCEATGIRSRELQATVPSGTVLQPGATWLAARAGTPIAAVANATYDVALNMLGSGVWLANEEGDRVDSVGIFAANEMDAVNVVASPCTKGTALTTYQPDRTLGETFQRSRFTGNDVDDFVTAEATPGEIDEHELVDPLQRVDARVAVVEEEIATEAATLTDELEVIESWSGVSDGALESERGEGELAGASSAIDGKWGHPYQRFVVDGTALEGGSLVQWNGESTGRNEVQFSVWTGSSWRLLDAGSGAAITLEGELGSGEIRGGRVTLLAQDGPRTQRTLAARPDGTPENPADYDLAISHITDTQYLSETYPDVYAGVVSWIADNAAARKIAFATHTGDLVQNWVDPAQSQDRARVEFARASKIQSILDDAGIPNSVLPGNHDNKRGVSNELFNEYFPVERYAGQSWFGGTIAPDDNSANFSTFEQAGAKFLMLSLPYAYGESEIAWAEGVVTAHPDHNVVVSTHEHVTPESQIDPAHRSANSRWVSKGQELWERVIAPNRNVVIVLSGHFHGLGQIRTENAGGIEGHDVVELLADYQEFRTHTGERATGFQRLLQFDLASSTVAVDTFSTRLDASSSFDYDYPQFVPDTGLTDSRSNVRPWRIVEAGVQDRYTAEDDEFTADVTFQYAKRVATERLGFLPPTGEAPEHEAASQPWLFESL
jgi:hypothetical protein